jgi:cytochrome P450
MTSRKDFISQQFFRNQADAIARLRAQGPVLQVHFPIIGKVWITTTSEVAGRVLKDSETFTLRKADGSLGRIAWWLPPSMRAMADNMLTMDEPNHTRLRQIVDEAFRRRAILDMEPRIFAMAERLADELFAEGAPADAVARYARKLPLEVISELLGLPEEDRATFTAWSARVTHIKNFMSLFTLLPAMGAMRRYLARRLDKVRTEGGEA